MIKLLFSTPDAEAGALVRAALRRSVSRSQVQWRAEGELTLAEGGIIIAINPTEQLARKLIACRDAGNCKIIVFGCLPDYLISALSLSALPWPESLAISAKSLPAPTYGYAESAALVRYSRAAEKLQASGWSRRFERFDFADEWNNLGYGAIRSGQGIWAVAQSLKADPACELAQVEIDGVASMTYAALLDQMGSSLLWINRPVGTIDSFEWRLIERFVSSYRFDELPCQPVVLEIPWGHDAAITMRLDCDEDVESARALWEAYRAMQVPFSLAVHASILADQRHYRILQEMVAAGESILSHTATHAPNWGGTYEAAYREACESAALIHAATGVPVRYAVSPFHQTPKYALNGLADAGYLGVVGGIIRNDPAFLIARGGELAGLPAGFVGHSQQTMLHGDCMLAGDDPLAIFKAAFDLAKETSALFGYLDHPFSERYQYGWSDEEYRIARHRDFVSYIRQRATNPLFLSENAALDFLRAKMELQIQQDQAGYRLVNASEAGGMLCPTVEYRGQHSAALNGAIV